MLIRINVSTGTINVKPQVARIVRVYNYRVPSGIQESEFTAKGDILVGTGASTYSARAVGSDGQVLTASSAEADGVKWTTPSIAITDATNFALNGGFDHAQRQTPDTLTTISNNTYSADQWKVARENADIQYNRNDATSESGLTSMYYGLFKKITNAGKFMVYQPIPSTKSVTLRGKTVIFQVKMKASSAKTIRMAIIELQSGGTIDTIPGTFVASWNADGADPTLATNLSVITGAESKSVTTSWQNFSVSVTVPGNSKNLVCAVWSDADFSANDTLSLAEAGLFLGSGLLAWTPRNDMQEIFDFCERISGTSGVLAAAGLATSTSVATVSLRYHRKYKTPSSITLGAALSDWTIRYSTTATTVTAITTTIADEIATLNLTATGTPLTAGDGVALRANNSSAYILIEAGL